MEHRERRAFLATVRIVLLQELRQDIDGNILHKGSFNLFTFQIVKLVKKFPLTLLP